MGYDELEPGDDRPPVLAEELCAESAWEDECVRRVPEMANLEDDREFRRCQDFLEDLDAMDADAVIQDLDECEDLLYRSGWFEDEHGGAVYLERHRDDQDDEG